MRLSPALHEGVALPVMANLRPMLIAAAGLIAACSSHPRDDQNRHADTGGATPTGGALTGGASQGGTPGIGGWGAGGGVTGGLGGGTGAFGSGGITGGTASGGMGGSPMGGSGAGGGAGAPLGGGTGGLVTGGTTSAGGTAGGLGGGGLGGGTAGAAGSATGGSAGTAGSGGGLVVGVPRNPVLPAFHADPQVAWFEGTFYIYPTTDGFEGWSSSAFHAFSSPDLVSWTDEGVILDLTRDVSWASSRAWAPGIAERDGTYFFYFSADTQIGVATASSPTGPFEDALGRPLITAGQYGGQSIDPYVFTDDDGRSYLYFGNGEETAHVVELNDDMISFAGPVHDLHLDGFREGSVAFRREGRYYFMWSVDDTRSENYRVEYGIGTSPLGPFTPAEVNPILQKDPSQGILATGHHSVLALPNGDYYIVYHRFAIPDGDGTHREVCIDRLLFNEDGTIVPVTPTR